jgi:hypothetical protein
MYFRLSCECGKQVSVTEGAAGTSLPCACGRTFQVPSLRELRQRAAVGDLPFVPGRGAEQPSKSVGRAFAGGCLGCVLGCVLGAVLGSSLGPYLDQGPSAPKDFPTLIPTPIIFAGVGAILGALLGAIVGAVYSIVGADNAVSANAKHGAEPPTGQAQTGVGPSGKARESRDEQVARLQKQLEALEDQKRNEAVQRKQATS